MKDLTLRIAGTSRAVRLGKVQRTLKDLQIADNPSINPATENAGGLLHDPGDLARIAEARQRAAYPMATDRLDLALNGLVDAAAVARAGAALAANPGMAEARVDLPLRPRRSPSRPDPWPPRRSSKTSRGRGLGAAMRTGTRRAAAARRAAEIRRLGRRTLVAPALALPVSVREMGRHLHPPFHASLKRFVSHPQMMWLSFLLTTAVMTGPGCRIYAAGIAALLRGAPDINARAAPGPRAASGFSTLAVRVPLVFPAGTDNVYCESTAVIVVLIPVASAALCPAVGLLLSPARAAFAMAMSSVCVLSNALRLSSVSNPAETAR